MSRHRDHSSGSELPDDERHAREFLAFDTPEGAAVPRPRPGARFGDFEVQREIGRGGMGVVYRAIQYPLGRAVALKLIAEPPAAAGATDAEEAVRAERLDREARILASLRHEGIVSVHAAGSAGGFRFVAMDLVEGTTLREILSGRSPLWPAPGEPGRLRLVLDFLHRVASALAVAHERGVIHRDVKPENVLVDGNGRPVLADFGLARDLGPADTASMSAGFVGTPRYASPEQVRGEPLSAASDVFSFGLVAFEALTGKPAFGASDETRLREAIEWRDPYWPRTIRLPKDVRAVVERCIEKRARDRYPDARAVESDLALLLRFEPVSAVARGRVAKSLRRVFRRPRRAAAAGVVLSVAAAALAAGVVVVREAARDARRAEARIRFEQALAAVAAGESVRAQAILAELVASGEPPPGARSLLADRLMRNGDTRDALELYRLEIAERGASASAGDRLAERTLDALLRGAKPSPPDPPATPVSARDHAMQSMFEDVRGDGEAALAALDRAVLLEPGAAEWRYVRGTLHSRQRRFVRAAADFRLAWHREAFPRGSVREFVRTLRVLGKKEEAESVLRASLAAYPHDATLYASHARTLMDLARPEEAGLAIAEALRLDPEDGFVLATASVAADYRGDRDESRAILERGLARRPGNPDLLIQLAYLELREGRYAEAEAAAQGALETPHLTLDALALITQSLEKRGRKAEAEENYPELRRRDPENPEWVTKHGHMLFRARRYEDAEAAFREAVAIDPMRAASYLGLGWMLRHKKDFSGAFDAYCRASALEPENLQPRYWLADVMMDLEIEEGTLFCLAPVLVKHPRWADAWALKGYALTGLGDLDGALAAFATAIDADPNYAEIRVDRADLFRKMGRDVEALADYAKAREINGDLATACFGEGRLRLESADPAVRDRAKGLELIERAKVLDRENDEYERYLTTARGK